MQSRDVLRDPPMAAGGLTWPVQRAIFSRFYRSWNSAVCGGCEVSDRALGLWDSRNLEVIHGSGSRGVGGRISGGWIFFPPGSEQFRMFASEFR